MENVTLEKHPEERWIVIRTRARSEKKIAEYCARRGLLCYLPLRRSVRRYKSKTAHFDVPIFPGYVFARTDENGRRIIEESRHVATTIVPDPTMETRLLDELRSLRVLEQATLSGELVVRPEIEVGQAVEIHTGPLTGMTGIVARRKGSARITVNVEMIGQSVSVEVDVAEVEMDL